MSEYPDSEVRARVSFFPLRREESEIYFTMDERDNWSLHSGGRLIRSFTHAELVMLATWMLSVVDSDEARKRFFARRGR